MFKQYYVISNVVETICIYYFKRGYLLNLRQLLKVAKTSAPPATAVAKAKIIFKPS